MGGMIAERQAADVALPVMGGIRVLDFDTNGLVRDVDAIITNIASAASPQVLSGASLNGVIGAGAISPARNLLFVFSSHADWDATTITVAGTDYAGAVLSEDFAVPDGGNATVSGIKLFATVTSVTIPTQAGAGGTATMGTGYTASLEEFAGKFITMIPSQKGYLICGAAGVAVSTPSSTAISGNTRGFSIPAETYFPGRPDLGVTDAFRFVGTAAGYLRWYMSTGVGQPAGQ